jgi:LysR family glycine cleavage system transcriptional activator
MPVNPPRPRGPSLNALRAFESAARLGGFSKAAEELSVSSGAVAQHVKTLEDWAGAALFTRHAQGLSLTALGAQVLPALTGSFDQMGEAVQSLRATARPEDVHVAALPSVAQLWLSPRLPEIRRALPGLNLSVSALEDPPNLTREPYDLAIFYARSGGEALEKDEIFPVCTPQLAAAIATPQDLARLPCLRDSSWADDWALWAALACPGEQLLLRGPGFSLYAMALQEALNGAGVLMAHRALVAPALADGRLVAPFDAPVQTGLSLRLSIRPGPVSPTLRKLILTLSGKGRL